MRLGDVEDGALFDQVTLELRGSYTGADTPTLSSAITGVDLLPNGQRKLNFGADLPAAFAVEDIVTAADVAGADIAGGVVQASIDSKSGKRTLVVEGDYASLFTPGVRLRRSGRVISKIGPLRLSDYHNRRITLSSAPTLTGNVAVELAKFDSNAKVRTNDVNQLNAWTVSKPKSGCLGFSLTVSTTRHRSADLVLEQPDGGPFLGIQESKGESRTLAYSAGDITALCFNTGRVTNQMLDLHAREYWSRQVSGQLQLPEARRLLAYIMGMTYHSRVSESLARGMRLFKLNPASFRAFGFSQFGYDLGSESNVLPVLDMAYTQTAVAGDWSLRPDAPGDTKALATEALSLFIAEISALEHLTINRFFPEGNTDAISTLDLLHRGTDSEPSYVELNLSNYEELGDTVFAYKRPDGTTGESKPLKEWQPAQWNSVLNALSPDSQSYGDPRFVRVYITKGPQNGARGQWKGMGTLITGPEGGAALIGQSRNLNGGFGGSTLTLNPPQPAIQSTPTLSVDGGRFVAFLEAERAVSTSPTNLGTAAANSSSLSGGQTVWSSSDSKAISQLVSQLTGLPPVDQQPGTGVLVVNETPLPTNYAQLLAGNLGQNRVTMNNGAPKLADPVDVLTGAFYVDTVDLSLPGSMPLEIRRNYESRNLAQGLLGHGWMLSLTPYLVVADGYASIYAPEMDGTVLKYTPVSGQTNEWEPIWANNPEMSNALGGGLHLNRLVRTGTPGKYVYTLNTRSGSVRTFRDKSFKIATGIEIKRPFLEKWQDHAGNYYEFSYYGDSSDAAYVGPDKGQLKQIKSSSGPYITFIYDASALVTEIIAGDGRRVGYRYDQHGDLIQVTRPDGTTIGYEYLLKDETVGGKTVKTSTHLIERERLPDGRIVRNRYDDQRRVTHQWSTAGTSPGNGGAAPGAGLFFADKDKINSAVAESYAETLSAVFDYSGLSKSNVDGTLSETGTYWTGDVKVHDAYGRATSFSFSGNNLIGTRDALGYLDSKAFYTVGESATSDGLLEQHGAFRRSVKHTIDRRGLKTEYKYDRRGNVTKITVSGDLDGDGQRNDQLVTTTIYNERDLPSTVTSTVATASTSSGTTAAGVEHRTEYLYEDVSYPFLPTKQRKVVGGSLVSETVTTYGSVGSPGLPPFSRGLVMQNQAGIPGDYALTTWNYDTRGLKQQQTRYTGVDQTLAPNVVTTYVYNDRHELSEEKDAAGRRTRFAYDDAGRPIWNERFDESGKQVSWNYSYYNRNGELEWTDGPRFGPEDYTYHRYDGMGRVVEEVVWRSKARDDGAGLEAYTDPQQLYATVNKRYNLFGDLIEVKDPLGHFTKFEYDDIGRVLVKRSYDKAVTTPTALNALASEQTSYLAQPFTIADASPAGSVAPVAAPATTATANWDVGIRVTDAIKGVTETLTTSTGQPFKRTNPDGTVTEWRYYLDGRLREEKGPGMKVVYSYDDSARTVSKQVVALNDSGTNLNTGLDPSPSVTTTDRRGNVVEAVDGFGSTVVTTYDHLGRALTVSQPYKGPAPDPLPLASRAIYSAAGTETRSFNGKDEETRTELDALGRPVLVQVFAPGSTTPLRQTSYAYSADHARVTTTLGGQDSSAPKIVSHSFTDHAGKPVIAMAADGTRSITSYDANGNADQTVVKPGLAATDLPAKGLITEIKYDALNRPVEIKKPDGLLTRTSYEFLGAGGLATRTFMPGNDAGHSMVEYQRTDSAGRLLRKELGVVDAAPATASYTEGSAAERLYTYSYLATAGAKQGLTDKITQVLYRDGTAAERIHTYGYDAWRRVSTLTLDSLAGGSSDSVTRTFGYETKDSGGHSGRDLVISLAETTIDPATGTPRTVTLAHGFDAQGRLATETVSGGGLEGHTFLNTYAGDSQRRERLSLASTAGEESHPRYQFAHTADDRLGSVTFARNDTAADNRTISYEYDAKGQLTQRSSPWRLYQVNAVSGRDNLGRLLSASTQVRLSSAESSVLVAAMTETLSWTADSRQRSYTAVRATVDNPLSTDPDAVGETDQRLYAYDAQSRRLLSESYGSSSESLSYSFDDQKRGIRISAQQNTAAAGSWKVSTEQAGGVDHRARVTAESSNDARRFVQVSGQAPDGAAIASTLFGEVPTAPAEASGVNWSVPLFLRPSAHPYVLKASIGTGEPAVAERSFTLARRAAQTAAILYDAEGRVIQRVFGGEGRKQVLTWDAAGRLTQVVEWRVNASPPTADPEPSYAWRWTALYDGLGRRCQTRTEWGSVTENGTLADRGGVIHATFTKQATRAAVLEESWYDPLVEFQELVVRTQRVGDTASVVINWRVQGPDADGSYGGLNGLGGLEAIYTDRATGTDTWSGVVDDYYGHIVGYVEEREGQTTRVMHWTRTRSLGYGPAPGSPVFHLSEGAELVQTLAWRGKRQDITGYAWLGARHYDPTGGRFLSPDPMGHGVSMSLYDYAGGDPVNFVDPDGRLKNGTIGNGQVIVEGIILPFGITAEATIAGLKAQGFQLTAQDMHSIHRQFAPPPPPTVSQKAAAVLLLPVDGAVNAGLAIVGGSQGTQALKEFGSPFNAAKTLGIGNQANDQQVQQMVGAINDVFFSLGGAAGRPKIRVNDPFVNAPSIGSGTAREFNVGYTPGRESKVGQQVLERMKKENLVRETGGLIQVLDSKGNWVSYKKTDMGHIEAAVSAWNSGLYETGARSPEVRKFMTDPGNYRLDSPSANRSDGGKMKEKYTAPVPWKKGMPVGETNQTNLPSHQSNQVPPRLRDPVGNQKPKPPLFAPFL